MISFSCLCKPRAFASLLKQWKSRLRMMPWYWRGTQLTREEPKRMQVYLYSVDSIQDIEQKDWKEGNYDDVEDIEV